jgi:Flp pilus assembly protein TadD
MSVVVKFFQSARTRILLWILLPLAFPATASYVAFAAPVAQNPGQSSGRSSRPAPQQDAIAGAVQGAKAGAAKPDVAGLMHDAEQALDRKDYAAAVDRLKLAVQAAPGTVPAWFDLGYAYTGLRQNDEARAAYEKAVQLDPQLFEASLNLGILLLDMKDAAAALPHLEKASALKPADPRAHFYFGRALAASGNAVKAQAEFRQALQLNPKLAPASSDLGQVLLGQKQYAEAAEAFQQALALDPSLAEAELGLAYASEGLGQQAEAEKQLAQYLSLRPDDGQARFHLASLYLQEKRSDEALAELQQLEQQHAAVPGLDAALGDAYALKGDLADSEQHYRQAVAAAPGQARLHEALAETLLKENKPAGAESEFRQSLQIDPGNADALKGLASSLYLLKRYSEVAPLVERLVQAPAAAPGLFFILATCYDHLQDRERALDTYQHFLDLSHGLRPDQEWQARQRVKLLLREVKK